LVFLESFALVCGAGAPMPLDPIPKGRGLRGIPAHEFSASLGQYLSYRHALEHIDPERELFLAIPSSAYHGFFQSRFATEMIALHKIALVVYNPEQEVIEVWH
jgi:hypothetical protein